MKIADENSRKYLEAKKRVEEEKKFYYHLGSYIAVNTFLVILNLITSPNHLWFYWPMLGWGLGLAMHALRVFAGYALFSDDWEEKRIKKYMGEDRHK